MRRRDWRTIFAQDAPWATVFVVIVALCWVVFALCRVRWSV